MYFLGRRGMDSSICAPYHVSLSPHFYGILGLLYMEYMYLI